VRTEDVVGHNPIKGVKRPRVGKIINNGTIKYIGDATVVEEVSVAEDGDSTKRGFRFDELGQTAFSIVQMVTDFAVVTALSFLSLRLVILLRPGAEFLPDYLYLLPSVASSFVMIFSFARADIYNAFNCAYDCWGVLQATGKRFAEVILLLTGCFFVLKISDDFSRLWLLTWCVTSTIGLCALRLMAGNAIQKLMQSGRLTKNVAIVGATEHGVQLGAQLVRERLSERLVGFFDQRCSRRVTPADGTIVAELSTLDRLLCRGRVDEVVIAIPPHATNRVLELARCFHPFPISLKVLAPQGYEHFRMLESTRYGDIGTYRVMSKPLDDVAVVVKWLEDKVIAGLCLLWVLPLMLVIAVLIKLDSRGPVFFKQKRLGVNNLPFEVFKFRTMYIEQADQLGNQLTQAGDPRITRVGRFLRTTSLDELPQLINVLRGEMSLVGPRPHALAASAAGVSYARAVGGYPIRHRVKPGITGWAQVNGWRGETNTIEQIRRRVEHDLYYIENWSLTFDLLILGRTLVAVLSRENAV